MILLPLRAPLPLLDLLPHISEHIDGIVSLRELLPDLEPQLKLRLQVCLRRGYPWILFNFKRLAKRLISNRQPHLVGTRRHYWPRQGAFCSHVSFHLSRVWIVQIPDKAIRSRLFGYTRFLLLVILLFAFYDSAGSGNFVACPGCLILNTGRLPILLLTREGSDLLPPGIEEGQFHFIFRLLLQIVGHYNAIRWVLSGIQVLVHHLTIGLFLPANGSHGGTGQSIKLPRAGRTRKAKGGHETCSRAWFEQVSLTVLHILAHLT